MLNTLNHKMYGLAPGIVAVCVFGMGCNRTSPVRVREVQSERSHVTGAVPLAESADTPIETPTTNETVTITDPVEASFTLEMPKGWRNQAYLKRLHNQIRVVVTSLSPDNNTLLYMGDPNIPSFMRQSLGLPITNPMVKVKALVSPEEFFPDYVKKKFGKLPDFQITSTGTDPEFQRVTAEHIARTGTPVDVNTTQVAFTYSEKGKPMHGLINGTILSNSAIWIADVSGISTTGDPKQYQGMLLAMADSHHTSPEWKRKEQENHETRMAILRQNHANDLALYRSWNRSHEMRMQAIQATGDASMQSWYQRQAQSDDNHRSFLNYINDEHTVVSSSGKAYQVDNAFERYYVNKNNNTYIGTKSTTDLDDLRRTAGVNPDDYEEVKIKR